MGAMSATGHDPNDATRSRRRYDGRTRREQAAGTRERIVRAASDLLHHGSVRDWRGLTVRAVADRAGVSERTVYRHFGNERGLRDAVMHHLEEQAGIELDAMRLEDVAEVTARIFEHVSTYPLESRPPLDPTLVDANQRQRGALLAAVADHTVGWREADRRIAAATLDVLWSVATYERLVADWRLDQDTAVRAVTWVIGLVAEAVSGGHPPGATPTVDAPS
jgi:AcrR family transcriptional regulator